MEKFCGELKKQRKHEHPFLPFSENIFTGCPSPSSYEGYTKSKEMEISHEGKGENGYGI